jgi:perosamine synthetase
MGSILYFDMEQQSSRTPNNSYLLVKERLDFISFLKDNHTKTTATLKAIIAGDFSLIPIGTYLLDDESTLDSLAQWRNTNVNVYPTRFIADRESTKNWMKNNLLNQNSKILFLVANQQGCVVGHLGLAAIDSLSHHLEVDNVAKWSNDLPTNSFSIVLKALMNWAKTTMYVEGFKLRVFSDNHRAINFYKKNHFIETRIIPMAKEPSSNNHMTKLVEIESSSNADEIMIEMTCKDDSPYTPNSLILTAGPSISQYEAVYAYDAALNGWNSEWSGYLTRLEQKFKEYVGVDYALATSSCTGALHIALAALGVGPGDEVIVPDQTWVATANAVRYVGATPVFVDVTLEDWTLDVSKIEQSITPKTKAIMPVHMYGHPAKMEQIMEIASNHNLYVVEDAAPSIGASYNGKKTGSFGHFAAFSFQGAKLMVTGEGGMLLTNDYSLYLKAKKVWDQGRNPQSDIAFWIDDKGLKYKMSNVQAAVGLGQLNRIETLVAMKRRIFSWYQQYLSGNDSILLNVEQNLCNSVYWMSSLRVLEHSPVSRNDLIRLLKDDNIDTRPVFPAISQYPIWDHHDITPQPVSLLVGNTCINLPSGVCLTESQVKYICSRINFHTSN